MRNPVFENMVVEFVNEISTNKTTPVAMRNINKGEKILIVAELLKEKFDNKAWTSPTQQKDGSYANALPKDAFKTFDEFLTFALLHEAAHNYILKESGETTGQYEDRVNNEAVRRLKEILDSGSSESSINTDMEEYQKLVEVSNGVQPKSFTVGTRTWTLNKFGNYDWSDPTTGQIYMRNINMETGESISEPTMNDPVDPALIEQSLNFIDSNRKLLALDHKFADMGYDINGIIRDLIEVKTMADYFKVKEILDKLC